MLLLSNHKSTLTFIGVLACLHPKVMFPLEDSEHTFFEREVSHVFDV